MIAILITTVSALAPAFAPTHQDPAPEPEQVRLEEWPKLDDKKQAKDDLVRVRKAGTEEMGRMGHEGLVAQGAAVVPTVLKAFAKERDEDANERLRDVLDAVTGAAHTRLLAREFGHRSEVVRMWALQRVAAFPDPGIAKEVGAILDGLREKKDKANKGELYAAALCLTSAGSVEGLHEVTERAREKWARHKVEIRRTLEVVRGREAAKFIELGLTKTDRESKITALRMLAGCGDEESVGAVKPFLDVTDNSLRVEAINALRGIVDGALPLEKLPVFEAIELAGKWKNRL